MAWARPRIAKIIRSTTDGLVLNAVFRSRVLKCAKDSRPFGADFSMRQVTSEETLSSQLARTSFRCVLAFIDSVVIVRGNVGGGVWRLSEQRRNDKNKNMKHMCMPFRVLR